ncbi:MAG: murein hydrolase activator EnvC family protein [Desulfonatronovibrionaceae bacterium]
MSSAPAPFFKINQARAFYVFTALLLLLMPAPDVQARDVQSELEEQKQELETRKEELKRLTRQEREIYSELADSEDRINAWTREIAQQEKKLQQIRQKEEKIAGEYQQLSREKKATQKELSNLLTNMWPVFLKTEGESLARILDWTSLDRQMNWLGAVYEQARQAYARLEAQSAELASGLVRLNSVKDEYLAEMENINQAKDRLLKEKLDFLEQLQQVRAQKLAGQKAVDELLEIIESLDYRLRDLDEDEFDKHKGHLTRPAKGRIIRDFAPSGNPPSNGLSFALPQGAPVKAISWGKVVHNDTLRGFGRVVILFHGQDYYSLYAYLSQSSLKSGQKVEKGEIIGNAGFYPDIDSYGLYFELRLRQKAINPAKWLGDS